MSFAIRKDGKGWRAVSGPEDTLPDEDFSLVQPADPAPTQADLVKTYEAALDKEMDAVAKAHRYDNRITFALRAGYEGPYQSEGIAFAQWMDSCYQLSNEIKNRVISGQQEMPSLEEFIESMPVFVLP